MTSQPCNVAAGKESGRETTGRLSVSECNLRLVFLLFQHCGVRSCSLGRAELGISQRGPVACLRWSVAEMKGLRSQEVYLGWAGWGGLSVGNRGRLWKVLRALPHRQIPQQARASRGHEGLGLGSWRTGIILVTPSQDSPQADAHPPSRLPPPGPASLEDRGSVQEAGTLRSCSFLRWI